MEVYIEYVILNNIAMTFLLLYWSQIAAKIRVKKIRTVIVVILSTLVALIMPLTTKSVEIAIKLVLPIVICAIFYKRKEGKNALKILACLILLTVGLGGIVLSIYNFGGYAVVQILSPSNSFMLGVIAASGIIGTYLLRFTIFKIKQKKLNYETQADVSIEVLGKKVRTIGFWDSGNRLYYKAVSPVIIVDKSIAKEINLRSSPKKEVSALTVSGEKTLEIFAVGSLCVARGKVSRRFFNVFACISEENLENYKVILHSEM